ncbi:MAG TPA: phosphatidate cytidylyltransferase, partial [Candidatus Omnitrophota bacterium]|nr:phosphatidate cytidylyltransferase [Candidatus Omnitrophota bacterium]
DKALMWICYIGIACIYGPIFGFEYGIFQAMPIYVIAFILTIPMHRDEYEHMIQKICLAVLGVVYFGWFFSHLAYLRNLSYGMLATFLLILLVESNDACAYLWGMVFGKHKLIPRLSPNKTVEGMFGATISVVGLAFAFRFLIPFVSAAHLVVLAFAVSVFGMCGDLTISFIKRDLKIKDMGNLIPGHGGLLDRFDSIIFTAPIFFHFLRYLYGE